MGRVAILHYTSAPIAGGVENQIEVQCHALLSLGCRVRLIVGAGEAPPGVELVRLPELIPGTVPGTDPSPEHPNPHDPAVTRLMRSLERALDGCDVCIAHNAFTVYLHPALTVALHRLAREAAQPRWVAWCYDLSQGSAYWPPLTAAAQHAVARPAGSLRWVASSHVTSLRLVTLFDRALEHIDVIPPALLLTKTLGLGPAASRPLAELALDATEPVVLVPAKLLPHKNLQLAVRTAAELRRLTPNPAVLLTAPHSAHQPETSAALRQELEALAAGLGASDAVHLVGGPAGDGVADRTVRDLMLLADVVLLTSTEEGFGIPLLEAMALRVPILCSDIHAFRENAPETARFFSLSTSPDALARTVLEIAASPANRARRRAAGSFEAYRSALGRLLKDMDGPCPSAEEPTA